VNFWQLKQDFESAADRSRRYSERHFRLFGFLAAALIPSMAFVEQAVSEPVIDTLLIRGAAGAVGLLLVFHHRLPELLKNRMEYVWIFSVTFTLPWCFGAILTLNAALSPAGTPISPIWIYQYLVALFIFIQLINHGVTSVLLWLTATLSIFLPVIVLDEVNRANLLEAWLYPLPVYLTALLIGSITNRNVHMVQAEQLRAASAIGGNIAHELRTPLASIRSLARTLRRSYTQLLDGYLKARAMGCVTEEIDDKQLNGVAYALETIDREVDYSNTIIDMLLVNTSDRLPASSEVDSFLASECVSEAIIRYPFSNSKERELVSTTVERDFVIEAPKLLMTHVIFNLLKNAVFYSQKSPHGAVRIHIGDEKLNRFISVMDTGPGIDQSRRRHIFDRFYTTSSTGQGAGVGLSFCKTVMESIGGSIDCESVEGEYTTFRLTFPPVNDDQRLDRRSRLAADSPSVDDR
jgi:two-component system, CAI-1 autoinducer sensor kinase/phosphatase CqsS